MSPKSADSENHFELTIVDSGDPSHAVAIARNGYDIAIEPLSCAEINLLTDFRATLVAASEGGRRPTEEQLFDFGKKLFDFIGQLGVHKIYNRLPDEHISLQIYSNRPDLQALPWEYIQPGKPKCFTLYSARGSDYRCRLSPTTETWEKRSDAFRSRGAGRSKFGGLGGH